MSTDIDRPYRDVLNRSYVVNRQPTYIIGWHNGELYQWHCEHTRPWLGGHWEKVPQLMQEQVEEGKL